METVTPLANAPRPAGAWTIAQRGSSNGVAWTMRVTAATRSGRCLTVDTTPPSVAVNIEMAGNGATADSTTALTMYEGHSADCAPGWYGNDIDLLAPVLRGDAGQGRAGTHYVAGLVTSGVTNIVVHVSDGTAVAATVADGTYAAWWSGQRSFSQLTFDYPGGANLECDNGGSGSPLSGIGCSGSM